MSDLIERIRADRANNLGHCKNDEYVEPYPCAVDCPCALEERILADAEALKAADALVDAIHNLADWQRYDATASHFPAEKPEVHECTDDARIALVSALTAYRKARGGE